MEYFGYIILALAVIYVIFDKVIKPRLKETNENTEETIIKADEKLPYKKKLLLTKNEWAFYKELKPIADELNLTVLAKVRMADLVEVGETENKSEWQKCFNGINKKHVDFALAKPENLKIELLIELDDNSHNTKQAERDEFTEKVYIKTGYKMLRTRGTGDLKEKIKAKLNIAEEKAEKLPPPIIKVANMNKKEQG